MDFLDLETLLRVPHVDPYSGFDISPDGKHVAFSWNRTGQWEIYELPLEGNGGAVQVSQGPGGKFGPTYAPDGKRIAYALDLDGSERFDAWVFDRASRRHTNLTAHLSGALQPNLSWSPDSARLAFISNHSGCFHTYVMPAAGGPERLVLALPRPDWDVEWAPDGRHLVVVMETDGQNYGVFVVPAAGGEPVQIAAPDGPINAQGAHWAPDGRRLAFSSDVRGCYDIGIYHLESREIRWVTESEGDDEVPRWSPDGQRLTFVRREETMTALATVETESGEVSVYQVEPGIHSAPRFTPDGAHLVFVFDNPRRPQDLWKLSLTEGRAYPLTNSLPSELRDAHFTMPVDVRYPGLDGVPVPALLYQAPQSEGPSPAVVTVHGGPNWLSQITWAPEVQHMASRGWVVLAPNYRGSTGYGRAWQLASRFDLGGVDTRDVVAGADYLVREGLAAPGRIGVTGRSHGGYLTMTALTQYPDRWAAGSAVVPFLNWFTSHENAREDLQHWDIENMGHPEENEKLWHAHSPFFFLDRIEATVQLICGANDPRCPASESVEARDALRALGKPVELLLYPDEGHGFLKRENVIDAEKKRVEFLAQALEE
jgi:dipeptidyl aminopeptidase/acylaminoacyl peptidase